MRLLTKEQRTTARETNVNYYIGQGWTKTEYKTLIFLHREQYGKFYLKFYKTTAGNEQLYKAYRTEAQMLEAIENIKRNSDRNAEYKASRPNQRTGAANTAQAIREELKANFAGVKFSVKSDNFAGGDSVHISWTDGVTADQVREITSKYQYGHFNGMEDIYEYSNQNDNIPQAKYVSEHRTMSAEAEADILTTMPYLQEWDERDRTRRINEVFYQTDYTPKTAPKQAESAPIKTDVQADEVQVIEYSAKAIAVIGNTKPIKDDLKRLGGKFNFRLSCGAGWIFSKTKTEEVVKFLQAYTAPIAPIEEEPTEQETTLQDEVNKTLQFFAETDIKRTGEISESTKECFKVQGVELPIIQPQVKEYTNLKDIETAVHAGEQISILNLFNLVNQKQINA